MPFSRHAAATAEADYSAETARYYAEAIGPDGRTEAEAAADPIIDGPEVPDVLDNPAFYAGAFARAAVDRGDLAAADAWFAVDNPDAASWSADIDEAQLAVDPDLEAGL